MSSYFHAREQMYNYTFNSNEIPDCSEYISPNDKNTIFAKIVELVSSSGLMLGDARTNYIGMYDYRNDDQNQGGTIRRHIKEELNKACYSLMIDHTSNTNYLYNIFCNSEGEPYSYILHTNLLQSLVSNFNDMCYKINNGTVMSTNADNQIVPIGKETYESKFMSHVVLPGTIVSATNDQYTTLGSIPSFDTLCKQYDYTTEKIATSYSISVIGSNNEKYFDKYYLTTMDNSKLASITSTDKVQLYNSSNAVTDYECVKDNDCYMLKDVSNITSMIHTYRQIKNIDNNTTMTIYGAPIDKDSGYYNVRRPNSTEVIKIKAYDDNRYKTLLANYTTELAKSNSSIVSSQPSSGTNYYKIYRIKPQFNTTGKTDPDAYFADAGDYGNIPDACRALVYNVATKNVTVSFTKMYSKSADINGNEITDVRLYVDGQNVFMKNYTANQDIYIVTPSTVKSCLETIFKSINNEQMFTNMSEELKKMLYVYINTKAMGPTNFVGVPLGPPCVITNTEYYTPNFALTGANGSQRVKREEITIYQLVESVSGLSYSTKVEGDAGVADADVADDAADDIYYNKSTTNIIDGQYVRCSIAKDVATIEPIKFINKRISGSERITIPQCFYMEYPTDMSSIDVTLDVKYDTTLKADDEQSYVTELTIPPDESCYYFQLSTGEIYMGENKDDGEITQVEGVDGYTYTINDFAGAAIKVATNGIGLGLSTKGDTTLPFKSVHIVLPKKTVKARVDYKFNGVYCTDTKYKPIYVDGVDESASSAMTDIEYIDYGIRFTQYGINFEFQYDTDGLHMIEPVEQLWMSISGLVFDEDFGFSTSAANNWPATVKINGDAIELDMGSEIKLQVKVMKNVDSKLTSYIDNLFGGIINSATSVGAVEGKTNIYLQYAVPSNGNYLRDLVEMRSVDMTQGSDVYYKTAEIRRPDGKDANTYYPSVLITNCKLDSTMLSDQLDFVASGPCPYFTVTTASDGTYNVKYKDTKDTFGSTIESTESDYQIYLNQYNESVATLKNAGYIVNSLFTLPVNHVTESQKEANEKEMASAMKKAKVDKTDAAEWKAKYLLEHPELYNPQIITDDILKAYYTFTYARDRLYASSLNNIFSIYVPKMGSTNGHYTVDVDPNGTYFRIIYSMVDNATRMPDEFKIRTA